MTPWTLTMALTATLAVNASAEDKAGRALEELRTAVCDLLAGMDPEPKDKAAAEAALRHELYRIVDRHAPALRPEKGTKTYVSADKRFVLVIAAGGAGGSNGQDADAKHKDAQLLLVVAGDGGPANNANEAGSGGSARAITAGVAVALGGRGGNGAVRMKEGRLEVTGGGGGGGVGADGVVGSVGLGGAGGAGGALNGLIGGRGGDGGGRGIDSARAIIEAARRLKVPPGGK